MSTGQDTLGTHLIQLVREVHRPYRDSVSVVSDYLLRNAEKDDLVYVPGFADREALTFYTGHHVRFCCHLDRNTPLPREKVAALQAPLYVKENTPDWIVGFGELARGTLERFAARYGGRRQAGRPPLSDAAPGAELPRLHAARCRQPRRARPAGAWTESLEEHAPLIRRGRGSSIRGDAHGQDERENREGAPREQAATA